VSGTTPAGPSTSLAVWAMALDADKTAVAEIKAMKTRFMMASMVLGIYIVYNLIGYDL
jgi:hypothetical protein